MKKMFDVTFCLCFWSLFGVFGVETDVLESVSVMEGDSVTLKNDDTEILRDDGIMWTFGPKQILIAHIKREDKNVINDAADGRFRGRIQLDQTGSLTITNTRTTDSGQYNATTKSKETLLKIFNITVYARLPVPVITTDSPHNSSSSESSSKCVLVCSVVNVTQETLSWYKGNSLFSSISVSDLNRSLSLPLECVDDSYSCVVNNPIRNQTKHLNITEVCQPCSASVQTREEEITYANPAIYQRKALKSKVKEEDDVVYAGVAVRR
ncbi:SLAM family member 9-like isoform X2 [Myxocyprinus asiaticus]|uniref:SLAM family member 9-like isoform X2 n=1 Tax=Myxocyprinus asiaticus TaxID=70543 RepID=UPI0022215955|nr:SLAM family member 9-like isoform X2 [Myxocyprinus asiaticus]